MKKCLSMLVAICLLATSLPLSAVAAALPFRDVPTTAWYLEGVQYVYDEGIMSGKSNTTFEPEANLQRRKCVRSSITWRENRLSGEATSETYPVQIGILSQ